MSKAWDVRNNDDWHALVYAETAAKARYVFVRWDWALDPFVRLTAEEFAGVQVRRAPAWDGLFPAGHVVESNRELMPEMPFYRGGEA